MLFSKQDLEEGVQRECSTPFIGQNSHSTGKNQQKKRQDFA